MGEGGTLKYVWENLLQFFQFKFSGTVESSLIRDLKTKAFQTPIRCQALQTVLIFSLGNL